ncbi:MAG: hypothetical protein LBD27_07715 [Tannerella sp.]|nr:hypothetical protein [Tannerella sp.]
MDFIIAPLVVWIIVSGVYALCELYARRKERMYLIERFGEKANMDMLNVKVGFPNFLQLSFSGLKIGCLLVGLGLGLLLGILINIYLINAYDPNEHWRYHQMTAIAYGASVFFLGGCGLIASFLIEKHIKQKRERSQEEIS